jgi:phospholipid transport system substrate-binding protein
MSVTAARVALAAALFALLAAPAQAEEEAAPDLQPARATVDGFYVALDQVVTGDADVDARKTSLAPAIDAAFDLPFMGAKVLGRHWRKLDDPSRQRWLETFRDLTISTWASRFPAGSEIGFELRQVEPAARGTAMVHTHLVRSEDEPVEIHYRLRETPTGWKIIDIYLNGSVSELALRRSEYGSVIERDGFDSLVTSLSDRSGSSSAAASNAY